VSARTERTFPGSNAILRRHFADLPSAHENLFSVGGTDVVPLFWSQCSSEVLFLFRSLPWDSPWSSPESPRPFHLGVFLGHPVLTEAGFSLFFFLADVFGCSDSSFLAPGMRLIALHDPPIVVDDDEEAGLF